MIEQLIGPELVAGIVAGAAAGAALLKKYGPKLLGEPDVETAVRNFIEAETNGTMPSSIPVKKAHLEDTIAEAYGDDIAEEAYFLDGEYWTSSLLDFEQIRALDVIESLPYRPARFDCENYAFLFQTIVALVFGINTVGVVLDFEAGHAYNIIYTNGGTLKLYEPQDGKYVQVGDSLDSDEESEYTLENSVLIF
jgi:hypothetical protein